MRQSSIDEHISRVESLVGEFASQSEKSASDIASRMAKHLRLSLDESPGKIPPTPSNFGVVRGMDRAFTSSLSISGYHDAIAAFVSQLPSQVGEFEKLYDEMCSDVPSLPKSVPITSDDGQAFGFRAALAVSALDSITQVVAANLRRSSFMCLGQVGVDDLVDHTSGIISKLGQVKTVGRDIVFSFFRGVAGSVYSKVDPEENRLLMAYSGKSGESRRKFCVEMLSSEPTTISSIRKMSNGQTPGVLTSSGGYGCGHYWTISGSL